MSIAEEIFAVGKVLKRKPIKAWGKDLWIFELDGAGREEYEASRLDFSGKKPKLNFKDTRAKLVGLSLRESDADDAPKVFQPAQVAQLSKLGGAELDRVYSACCVLSGISGGDDEEDPAKNFAGQSIGSSSV